MTARWSDEGDRDGEGGVRMKAMTRIKQKREEDEFDVGSENREGIVEKS